MNWWMEKPYRMVQNNLRDIDGAMDVDYELSLIHILPGRAGRTARMCDSDEKYAPRSDPR